MTNSSPRDTRDTWDSGLTGEFRGASWQPVHLAPYLNGEVQRQQPSIGIARQDGLRLIYAGLEHSVIGEMESGKTWLCLACCAAEMAQGRNVVYIHFEEADPSDTVDRLLAMGVLPAVIGERFSFVGPNEPVDEFARAGLVNLQPSLVILDGINEAMSLHGLSARDEGDVAGFRRRLVKPFTAVGAAVLGSDHVVKDRERRDRGPLGSVHKGNALSGSLILLENVSSYGRGERGVSHVFVTKDRPGFLRSQGQASRATGRTFMGTLIVDDTKADVSWTEVTYLEPAPEVAATSTPSREEEDDVRVLGSVLDLLAGGGAAPSQRAVRAMTAAMSNERVDSALVRLVHAGRLVETRGPNRSRVFGAPEVVDFQKPGEGL